MDTDPPHTDPPLIDIARTRQTPTEDETAAIICPMPCAWCDELGPGGCEDCLDCLLWPEVVPLRTPGFGPRVGPTAPTMTRQLQERREELDLGSRVGLVSRRFRRQAGLSQRGLADDLGWSQAGVNRAETDASRLPVHRLDRFLRHLGHRLAIVPVDAPAGTYLGEDPDEAWGAPDLLARDCGRRRLPPHGLTTWNDVIDRRLAASSRGHEAEWTWQRPDPSVS